MRNDATADTPHEWADDSESTDATAEFGQVRISEVAIWWIRPSPENARLYKPIDPEDPDIISLADSIREHGIQEPLITTADGYIVSGHRRFMAAQLTGMEMISARVLDWNKDDEHDKFLRLLRECNRQRVKSVDELIREQVIDVAPEDAYGELQDHRQAAVKRTQAKHLQTIDGTGRIHRAKISKAKQPLLNAVLRVLEEHREFLPTSVRRLHYGLLNNPPLVHASKPDSIYRMDDDSYGKLDEFLTRARLVGLVPMDAIADETRPIILWDAHPNPQTYLQEQLDGFLEGYFRNRQTSQPNHIEIIVEKNTLLPIVKPVAAEFTIPITSGRGQMSLPPRAAIAERYRRSGKDRLVLLILTDHDPSGEAIAEALPKSLRGDFGIKGILAKKVAITADQAEASGLPGQPVKKANSAWRRAVRRHGEQTHELEAIEPRGLQRLLREAIHAVSDLDLLEQERQAEAQDAAFLHAARQRAQIALAGIGGDEGGEREDDQ